MKPIDHLIEMAERIEHVTGRPANVMRMPPTVRDRLSAPVQRRPRESLPPVLQAFQKRERKRGNRRRRAARIRRQGR